MNHESPWHWARAFRDECWLFIKTEWRFHSGLCIVTLLVFLLWSLWSHDPTIFQRSGALRTITGAIMMYRGHFRGIENEFLRATGRSNRRAFRQWHPLYSKEEARIEDQQAFRHGFRWVILGTLIWAYGDLLLLVLAPCMQS